METSDVPTISAPPPGTPPEWLGDPTGRHQYRYWSGSAWTDHVADAGTQTNDPLHAPSLAAIAVPEAVAAAPAQPAAVVPTSEHKVPRFGARKAALQLQEDLDAANTSLRELGGLDYAQVQQAIAGERQALAALTAEAQQTEAQLRLDKEQADRAARVALELAQAQLEAVRREIVATQDVQILQEVGVYEYQHPLSDAAGYQEQLKALQVRIKAMNRKDGGAVSGAANWTVNGSVPEGKRMVRETCKLMLRAYNAEADNLVRSLKPYKLDAATARLDKVAETITKLGKTMSVTISRDYHVVRLQELELTADYLAKKEEEKEAQRAEKARLREEAKVQQEMARERERLEKEQAHYRNALQALEAKGDEEAAARLRERLAEIDTAIEDVDYRAANARAGYVYVISNIGAFGESVVKVGLTRRLEPLDRVRELGDASVPFRYDVHALFFAKDAVGIEHELHQRLSEYRINRVNLRREFFRVTPDQAKQHLLELAGDLLEFTDTPEALEYRQSLTITEETIALSQG